MLAEKVAPLMIKMSLKGTRFYKFEPDFSQLDLNHVGWYIHMPFCHQICPYCCFRSLKYKEELTQPYVDAIKKELQIYREKLGAIETGDIYFGGGTPSITWKQVIEIAEYIQNIFKVRGEFGMEASPEDIKEDMCNALYNSGIRRISLGIQSFNERLLRVMQRRYTEYTIQKSINMLLSKGFFVSIDLLSGLPQQSISTMIEDLQKAVESRVHQISVYPIMFFSYTRWSKDRKAGRINVPPSGSEREMFYAIVDHLTSNGFKQSTCWDFNNTQNDYNIYATCTRDENIGVGLSAYSKIGNMFYVNTFYLKDYINALAHGLPIATGTNSDLKRIMRRWFMMGLYRLKVNKKDFEKKFHTDISTSIRSYIRMFKLLNLIKEDKDCIKVTRDGMYWISLMTKASMMTMPGTYYRECLKAPWPREFVV